MIITMVSVRVVQVAAHQIIHMIAVGNGLVSAARAMHMRSGMGVTVMALRAFVRILRRHGEHVYVKVIAMRMQQAAMLKVVGVAIVINRKMATGRAVIV